MLLLCAIFSLVFRIGTRARSWQPVMADGTRGQEQRKLEDTVKHLKDSYDKQAVTLQELFNMMTAMNMKLEQFTTKAESSESRHGGHSSRLHHGASFLSGGGNPIQAKFSKLYFPTFDGDNPTGWIYKCGRFFYANGIVNEEKVGLASIHLEGKALEWFQGYEAGNKEFTWDQFSQDVIARFGPSTYDSPMGQLSKLKQTSTVRNYQEQFETLMARTTGLPDEFFVHCFVSGLKEVIKNQVTMFRPTTLPQAIGLALLQEGTMEAIIKEVKGPIKNNTTRVGFSEASKGNNNQLPPIKKISAAEMQERRDKKLCYYVMKNMSLAIDVKRGKYFCWKEKKMKQTSLMKTILKQRILLCRFMPYLGRFHIKP